MKRKHTAPAASTGGLPQPMAAPQLEFVDGRIVVRESSLVVGAEPNMLLEEGEAQNPATYHSYRPKSANASARWGIEETRFFFRAIQQVGQDFSLMQAFLPGRTRDQIKKKFVKEDKQNPELIRAALQNRLPLAGQVFEKRQAAADAAPTPEEMQVEEHSVGRQDLEAVVQAFDTEIYEV